MTTGRPRGAKNVPWDAIIERLRKQPDTWMLPSEMSYVNARTIAVVRRRERRALRLPDGVIRCRPRTYVILEDGETVMCALFLKFQPTKERPHDDEAEARQPHQE